MKKQVRITALFPLLALAFQFASCGGADNIPSDTSDPQDTTAPETADPASVSNLPGTDWGGREFRVLGYEDPSYTQFNNFEVFSDAETGDVVNDAVYRRNSAVEDKYNVKISQTLGTNGNLNISNADHIRKTVMAQENLYDLAFTTIKSYGTLAREGLLFNLNDVGYIDFTKNYWNPEVNNALSYDGKLYFTSSDFSLRDKNRAYIMVYNRDMADEQDLGDPIWLVRTGAWTIDTVTQWSKTVANDVNGNGKVDEQDIFGITMDSYNAFSTLMTACGNQILAKNGRDEFELAMNNEHTINSIDKVLALTGSPDEAIFCNDWNGKVDYDFWEVSGKIFKEGRALFVTAFPHSLKGYSADCEFEYGIIPFPKYDEKQENYRTMADIYCMLFSIPASNPDPDFAGFMLEALSAAATETSLQAYYEISCKTKYTYDPDSAEMLDLIFSNIVYEPAIMYEVGNLSSIYESIAASKTNNFAALYASAESAALADLDKLAGDLGKIE